MKKYLLSFQTVFRLNENVKWLEEFLIYYINIGFDHFYLYDNDGSVSDFDKSQNKHGYKISNNEPTEDKAIFDRILEKYGDKITYTKWKPINKENEIIYGQDYATMDFIKKYADETEWIALMDLDEFLISVNNIDIPNYFRNLPNDVSCIKLGQKPFINRFESNQKYITQDYRCIDTFIKQGGGGSKNIVRVRDLIDIDKIKQIDINQFDLSNILHSNELISIDQTWNLHIHSVRVKNKILEVDQNDLRFNHYQIKNIENLNGYDDNMKKYTYLFENKNSNIEGFETKSNYLYYFFLLFVLFVVFLFFTSLRSLNALKFIKGMINFQKNKLFVILSLSIVIFFSLIIEYYLNNIKLLENYNNIKFKKIYLQQGERPDNALQFMYNPIILSITKILEYANPNIHIEYKINNDHNFDEIRPDDVLIWVGCDRIPDFNLLNKKGIYTIYYNTEPDTNAYTSNEIWTYSKYLFDNYNKKNMKLIFIGKLDYRPDKRDKLLNNILIKDNLEEVYNLWNDNDFNNYINNNVNIFLNLTKSGTIALPSVRINKLLSHKCIIISEHTNEIDEEYYKEIIYFCDINEVGNIYKKLNDNTNVDLQQMSDEIYEKFYNKFNYKNVQNLIIEK